jgi:hypothetical protein
MGWILSAITGARDMKITVRNVAWRIASMMLLAIAGALVGCGSKSIVGKTYETTDGDTIAFQSDGKATERNGDRGSMYAGQAISMDSAQNGSTPCTYTQDSGKVTLACAGAKDEKAVYTVNDDGSLTGPPDGIWGQKAFAHMTEKK